MNFKILSLLVLTVLISSSSVISASAESMDVQGSEVEYMVNGASVSDMMMDDTFSSLLVNLDDADGGEIQITIPRSLLDAKLGNLDDIYFVLIDDLEVDFNEVSVDSAARTLSIEFPLGSEVIEIIGTDVGSGEVLVEETTVEETTVEETIPEQIIDKQASASVEAQSGSKGGGCLIATAAFGTELAPQVQFLREIRDNTVLSTSSGAAFMTGFNQFYYSFSPTIADWERENPVFKESVRAFITPMISTLSIMTLADDDSEVEVLGLGISVIALNLAMYIATPTIVVWQVKKRI